MGHTCEQDRLKSYPLPDGHGICPRFKYPFPQEKYEKMAEGVKECYECRYWGERI
jgi:hypothetical protein